MRNRTFTSRTSRDPLGRAGLVALLTMAIARPAFAESEPGGPTLEPTAASLDVLIPIVTPHGTTVERRRASIVRGMRPLIPIVTPHGTIVEWHAADRTRTAEPARARDDASATDPSAAAAVDAPSVARDAAPGGPSVPDETRFETVSPPKPSARPRTATSLALHYEAGYFGPGDVNAEIAALADIPPRMVLFGGLGLGFELRPIEMIGLSLTASYLLAPPVTVQEEVHYLHSFAGTAAARLYIPTVDALDIAMGVEGSLHWAGYRGYSGAAPGFVWRFGVQLVDPDLPAVLATIFIRRAKVVDEDFEIDLSGIGAMADFSFDL